MHDEKEGEKREKTTTTLFEKKGEASNVSEQRDKGWIQWQQHGRATDAHELPHTKKEWEVPLNSRDYPPNSYIVNERYNLRNKRASQEKKTVNGKNR